MSTSWSSIILNTGSPAEAWQAIFAELLSISRTVSSPVALHEQTVIPDRLLSESAWELWHAYPQHAVRTAQKLTDWCGSASSDGKAVLILDALSLRELPLLLGGAQNRDILFHSVEVTGAECPSTTDQFAKALGIPSRSSLSNDNKPKSFSLFSGNSFTDVISMPFEDCSVPPSPNLFIWHSWLDDLIHLQKKLPDQIASIANTVLRSDGFWSYVNKLRKGRKLLITSDHGYAVSKLFSSQVTDSEAIDTLRDTFGASRYKAASGDWAKRFMPPLVMTLNQQHVVMGQWKWKVQGGFPHVCHGGMSLLEVVVPFVELAAL